MDEERPAEGMVGVEVPWQELAPETLRNVVEEYVTREGTEYGQVEFDLESKIDAVMRQLRRGEAKLVYDFASESVNIVEAKG